MSSTVLDASAVLVALNSEPGADLVAEALSREPVMSAVNLAEVVAKLTDWGLDEGSIRLALGALDLQVVGFDAELAYVTGLLRPSTRQAGLGVGDRACLALASRLNAQALTADRTWADLSLAVEIRVVRSVAC